MTGINAWCLTCGTQLGQAHNEEVHRAARLAQLQRHWPGWRPSTTA